MKKRFVSVVVLTAAIGCLHAPTQSAAQWVTPGAKADLQSTASETTTPQNAQERPKYPISKSLFAEALAQYIVGSDHRAMYANITGDQMWSIVESKFGNPNAPSAIADARRLCENHAVANKLDPNKCVPVAINDRVVYDPGPLFLEAERVQAQQHSIRIIEVPHQE